MQALRCDVMNCTVKLRSERDNRLKRAAPIDVVSFLEVRDEPSGRICAKHNVEIMKERKRRRDVSLILNEMIKFKSELGFVLCTWLPNAN